MGGKRGGPEPVNPPLGQDQNRPRRAAVCGPHLSPSQIKAQHSTSLGGDVCAANSGYAAWIMTWTSVLGQLCMQLAGNQRQPSVSSIRVQREPYRPVLEGLSRPVAPTICTVRLQNTSSRPHNQRRPPKTRMPEMTLPPALRGVHGPRLGPGVTFAVAQVCVRSHAGGGTDTADTPHHGQRHGRVCRAVSARGRPPLLPPVRAEVRRAARPAEAGSRSRY